MSTDETRAGRGGGKRAREKNNAAIDGEEEADVVVVVVTAAAARRSESAHRAFAKRLEHIIVLFYVFKRFVQIMEFFKKKNAISNFSIFHENLKILTLSSWGYI